MDRTGRRPGLVVDIDGTLLPGGAQGVLRLAFGRDPLRQAPYPGAPDALAALAVSHEVVLLTARDDAYAKKTLEWLDVHGFPARPVVFSPVTLTTAARRERYKRLALAELGAEGFRAEAGVGDSVSDVLAYAEAGALPILVVPDKDRRREVGARVALATRGHDDRALEIVPFDGSAWMGIRRRLERDAGAKVADLSGAAPTPAPGARPPGSDPRAPSSGS